MSQISATSNQPPHRPSIALSFDRISTWIDAGAPELRREQFVAKVGVLRGGLFPALWVNDAIGAPLYFSLAFRGSPQVNWCGNRQSTE